MRDRCDIITIEGAKGGVKMKRFIDWAFYGEVPEGLEMKAIYESYLIYCKLFNIDELSKFEFIQLFNSYREQ